MNLKFNFDATCVVGALRWGSILAMLPVNESNWTPTHSRPWRLLCMWVGPTDPNFKLVLWLDPETGLPVLGSTVEESNSTNRCPTSFHHLYFSWPASSASIHSSPTSFWRNVRTFKQVTAFLVTSKWKCKHLVYLTLNNTTIPIYIFFNLNIYIFFIEKCCKFYFYSNLG